MDTQDQRNRRKLYAIVVAPARNELVAHTLEYNISLGLFSRDHHLDQ
ncbi:TPA: hypothetical protein NOE00_002089 [Pseudomonas aeruginosa]|nr:hypothetical protein [Pseudomonas aeruginosa]